MESGQTATQISPKALALRGDWLHAMESSVAVPRVPSTISVNDLVSGGTAIALMGWVIALACFFGLLSLQLKVRRREKLLQRGSRPDIFLYHPNDRDRR